MKRKFCLALLVNFCFLLLSVYAAEDELAPEDMYDTENPDEDTDSMDPYTEDNLPPDPDADYDPNDDYDPDYTPDYDPDYDPDYYPDGSDPNPDETDGEEPDSEYGGEEETHDCAGLFGRDRVLCQRELALNNQDENPNPCEGLTGRERGMCERDKNKREPNPSQPQGGGYPHIGIPSWGRPNRGRPHGGGFPNRGNPCNRLRGWRRRQCLKRQRGNRDRMDKDKEPAHGGDPHGADVCAGLRGPQRRKCIYEHQSSTDDFKELPDSNSFGAKEISILEPIGTDRIRLAGNSSYYNGGLVKIFRNNSWGYVCDDDWDIKDADVACKQLGYKRGASEFVSASRYGIAKDAFYLMDDVNCVGDEMQLQRCSYTLEHDCQKDEAAGVICETNTGCDDNWIAGPNGCYRLFSGSSSRYSAESKCKSINGHLVKIETKEENDFLSTLLRIRKTKHYWLTDGMKGLNWVWKTDRERIRNPFWFPGWQPQSMFPKPSSNRLERCIALANAFRYDNTRYVTEYFYWDNVNCNKVSNFICETEKKSTESTPECYTGIGTDYRGTTSVTVKGTHCVKWTKSRKINPLTHPNAGLGEHNYCRNPDGDKRPWCWVNYRRNLFGYCDIPDCEATSAPTTPLTTKAITTVPTTTAAEDSINCPKKEMYCASSDTCIALSWKCDNEKDCTGGEDELNCDYKLGLFNKKDQTFVINKDPVEVYFSVPLEMCARLCVNNRDFACKAFYYEKPQNHCNLYNTNVGTTALIPRPGTYYVLQETCGAEDFVCKNGKCLSADKICNEYNDCGDYSDEQNCDTTEHIEIRLVDGPDEHSGRVEIKYLNEWGIICDDKWDIKDANVVCRMLGYDAAESAFMRHTISDGDRHFLLSNVECNGNETSLLNCKKDPWGSHQCKSHEVVGVVCQVKKVCPLEKFTCDTNKCIPYNYVCDNEIDCEDRTDERECNVKVELVGGVTPLSGRVQITRGGVEGSICDDGFGDKDATVICKMMGHSSGRVIPNTYGQGNHAIWLDELSCTGTESDVEMCPDLAWGEHDCTHEEDVAVRCYSQVSTTIAPTPSITPSHTFNESAVICGRRPRAPRTRREERTVAKPNLSRIVGGTNATYGHYPWQVAVRLVDSLHPDGSKSSSHWCGASILSDNWVVSAAHCFPKRVKKDNVLLRTGDLNSKIWDTYEQSFEVEHLITHPDYDTHSYDYDVALIKLKPDRKGNGIIFNDHVQPVCLPPDNLRYSPGTRCEISGWGSTGQIYPSILKAATVPLLSTSICKTLYKDITPRMICAGYLEGGIDTCQGDSGGPLVCNINGLHTLIGITSWGNGCAKPNYPGVYANVANLKPWILATLSKYS